MPDLGRRAFLKVASGAAVVAGTRRSAAASHTPQIAQDALRAAENPRAYWVDVLRKLSDPILTNLAAGTLKARMPVEAASAQRRSVTHLEAVGRLLAGIAPWLELGPSESDEGRLRGRSEERRVGKEC